MSIIVRDSGIDKTVNSLFAYESGADKEVQEVVVHDSGTDKTVYKKQEEYKQIAIYFNNPGSDWVGVKNVRILTVDGKQLVQNSLLTSKYPSSSGPVGGYGELNDGQYESDSTYNTSSKIEDGGTHWGDDQSDNLNIYFRFNQFRTLDFVEIEQSSTYFNSNDTITIVDDNYNEIIFSSYPANNDNPAKWYF
ncbi:MAG: hypothetical protein ABEI54_03945 [Candidatus Bipolaricaulia bacterium]